MQTIILRLAMTKQKHILVSIILLWQPVLAKENSQYKYSLKNYGGGIGKYIYGYFIL